jgi:dihydroxy-acid dehydratase
MLKAVGFTDADLVKPLIGVANTWIEIGPCNYHLAISPARKRRHRAAGGTPMEFNTVSISDGITMNTEDEDVVSREVMTDSIELVARGNGFDGLIVLVGCDKTIPAGVVAGASQRARSCLYGGSIAPGHWHGKDDDSDVFEAVGAQAAGKMSLDDLRSLESAACPAGACGGHHGEHHGHRG